tara:strand:+ start:1015 stop:1560 length:546 start_codon:yes stop_codon:yes gene_type:complete
MPYKNPEDKIANDKAYREANKDKILAQKKAYYRAHLKINKKYYRAYYKANKEKIKAQREANKKRIKAYNKAWREANREKITTLGKAYYQTNKGARNAMTKAYQERKKQNDFITTEEDKQIATWIYTMTSKLTETTGIKWHVDHIKPLSKGGMHSLNNLQIVPAIWNLQKNNNNEERWNGKD